MKITFAKVNCPEGYEAFKILDENVPGKPWRLFGKKEGFQWQDLGTFTEGNAESLVKMAIDFGKLGRKKWIFAKIHETII